MSNVKLKRLAAGSYITDESPTGNWWSVNAYYSNGCVTQSGWVVTCRQRNGSADDHQITLYKIVPTLSEARRLIDRLAA